MISTVAKTDGLLAVVWKQGAENLLHMTNTIVDHFSQQLSNHWQ